jgi:hypothetical protein
VEQAEVAENVAFTVLVAHLARNRQGLLVARQGIGDPALIRVERPEVSERCPFVLAISRAMRDLVRGVVVRSCLSKVAHALEQVAQMCQGFAFEARMRQLPRQFQGLSQLDIGRRRVAADDVQVAEEASYARFRELVACCSGLFERPSKDGQRFGPASEDAQCRPVHVGDARLLGSVEVRHGPAALGQRQPKHRTGHDVAGRTTRLRARRTASLASFEAVAWRQAATRLSAFALPSATACCSSSDA